MKRYKTLPICAIGGFASILFFCVFAFISMIFFTRSWNPLHNTLSQLGNSSFNPNGAIFFTIGLILAGLSLLVFYRGFFKRYSKKYSDKKLMGALAFGYINVISIILTGIFSESVHYNLHIIFSIPIFITFIPILYLLSTFLISNSIYTKAVSYYGYVVAIFTLILLSCILFSGIGGYIVPLFESISVFSYIGWIGVLSYKNIN